MFARTFLLVLTCCCGVSIARAADDLREKTRPPAGAALPKIEIDVEGGVFGLRFGASEEEVMQKLGKPAGYLRLDEQRTVLVYPQNALMLLFEGKFDAFRIGRMVLDHDLGMWLSGSTFGREEWSVSNGLRARMSRQEVLALLPSVAALEPSSFASSKYRLEVPLEKTFLQLSFSHMTNQGDGDDAYQLM